MLIELLQYLLLLILEISLSQSPHLAREDGLDLFEDLNAKDAGVERHQLSFLT